jgi:hypothetical protein
MLVSDQWGLLHLPSLINVLDYGQNNVLFHAAMMYAVVIIYGFVGMRFYTAMIAGWCGG